MSKPIPAAYAEMGVDMCEWPELAWGSLIDLNYRDPIDLGPAASIDGHGTMDGWEDKRTRRTGRYKAREGMRRTRWSVVGGGAGKVRKLKFNGEWNLPNKSHSQKPGLWWMIYFVDHLLIIMIGHYAAMDRGGSERGSRQEDLAELRRSSQDIDLEMLYILWSCPCA